MKIDYSYHYRKWNQDTPEQRALAVKMLSDLYGEHLPRDKNARILDVGCGSGYMLETLRALGYENAVGIDIDPGQVDACRKKNLNVTLVEDSRAHLEQNAAAFDQLLAFDLIEHVPPAEQLAFVAAMANALKPGGSLMCTTPNANSFLGLRYRYIDWTHHSSFTEHSLDFLLYSGGFRGIRILPAEKEWKPDHPWWPNKITLFWWARKITRGWRRLNFMAELGGEAGRKVPLSPNLLGLATRP